MSARRSTTDVASELFDIEASLRALIALIHESLQDEDTANLLSRVARTQADAAQRLGCEVVDLRFEHEAGGGA